MNVARSGKENHTIAVETTCWDGYMSQYPSWIQKCCSPKISPHMSAKREHLPKTFEDTSTEYDPNYPQSKSYDQTDDTDTNVEDNVILNEGNDAKKKYNVRKALLRTLLKNRKNSEKIESRCEASTPRSELNIRSEKDVEKDLMSLDTHDVANIPTKSRVCDQANTEQVCKSYWNSISTSGIWESTRTDDVSINSDNMSCVSVESTNEIITEVKADLSAVGDDDSTCCSVNSDGKLRIIKLDDRDSSNDIVPKQPASRVPCILNIEKKKEAIKGALFAMNNDDLSKQIKNKSAKLKMSTERGKKVLLKKLKATISSRGRYDTEVANVLLQLADFHQEKNQQDVAQLLLKEALSIYCASLGDHHEVTIATKKKIGIIHREQKKFDEALSMYHEVLSMEAAINGENNVTVARTRELAAEALNEAGQSKYAVKEMKKALKCFRQEHGDENMLVASSVEKIAYYYSCEKDHKKSNLIYGELVKLRLAIHGADSLELAHALMKWARSFEILDDYDKAMKLMKQAYLIFHEMGEDEVDDANALRSVGNLYSRQGRYDKAIKAYSSSLLIFRRKLGDTDATTAGAYLTLGIAFRDSNRHEKAMKSLNRAMTIYGERMDKDKHMSIMVVTVHEIGVTYQIMGKYQLALKAFFREHSIRMKFLPNEEYNLARCIRRIGLVYLDLQKYEAAKNFFLESLVCFDRSSGRKVEFAENLYDCARVFQGLHKQAEAAECYVETVLILKANGKTKNHPLMKEIQNLLDEESVHRLMSKNSEPTLYCGLLDKNR